MTASRSALWPRDSRGQCWPRAGLTSDAPLCPQVLYTVFESFVTLGGDKVTGVDCVKGIGVWLAGP